MAQQTIDQMAVRLILAPHWKKKQTIRHKMVKRFGQKKARLAVEQAELVDELLTGG